MDDKNAEFLSISFIREIAGEMDVRDGNPSVDTSPSAALRLLINSISTRSLARTIRWRRHFLRAQLIASVGAVIVLTIALSRSVLGT